MQTSSIAEANFPHVKPAPASPAPARPVLSDLAVGQDATVEELDLPDNVQYHLMHMGFVPGARVVAAGRAPAGDPTVYSIDGMEVALRRETARSIHVTLSTPDRPR